MPSERTQRHIDRLLDEADAAVASQDWEAVLARVRHILTLDPENEDAISFQAAAERGLGLDAQHDSPQPTPLPAAAATPSSFASGRYTVKKFLGEGGKKKVYLAHDTLLDRDVAFALIKTEGLDDVGRDRVAREAKAMGRLGAHPHIVSVYDLGEEHGQPYMVTELMGGGDVEGLIEKASEHRPPLERTLKIGIQVCRGLEFAHTHGIVHRDLKPGNVWLTADGTAKLGDFGLAVALDKSRLTQAGMMVGTVAYMPPEQAMGGEVTPRSDLYSLGAMLYEMVTGRPPFVGHESVAIITQHLNAQPVAPSWHSSDVPNALETLILRLLEKDLTKRPASAAEVREALELVHPATPQSAESVATVPTSDNPMYRRTFVGREAELRQLQAAYDAAGSGQGGLVMVVGEPGIGKTSLIEQLATYATVRGGRTLVGHCYEEGSLSLPYLPFVEALRSYVLAREPDGLRQDLGSGAGDVARIVSEIRDRLNVELPPTGAPEDDRWRLLQAVCGFIRNAASVQPLVMVLEDLHDADRGTLDLLLHLSRNLQGARMLIVGTYRDVEVDRAHPLSSTLAELRRSPNFLRVPLRGLTAVEVQRMMASVSRQDIPWPLAELVYRQTEGNPLFVQEMLRFLVEEGLVERRQGALRRVGEEALAGRIPEGLRDVIGKRLSRLSERTNQVLSIASVIGRDFSLDTLRAITSLDEELLVTALEEALHVGVLEEQSRPGVIRYRFAHAFFRQTLYEELIAPRRLRLHQQIGAALERQYAARLEEHAAELAEHFAQSTDPDDLAKAVHYGELAARRALSVYAYGETVRHLEQALGVQEVLDPDDAAKRCELLLALGEALIPAGESQRAADEVAPEVLELAERLGARQLAFRACSLAFVGMLAFGQGAAFATPAWREWAQRANRYAETDTLERVQADIAFARALRSEGKMTEAWALGHRGLTLAQSLRDDETTSQAYLALLGWPGLPQYQSQRLRLAQEYATLWREGPKTVQVSWGLSGASWTLLSWGERAQAESLWRDFREMAERVRAPGQIAYGLLFDSVSAALDGRLEEAVAAGMEYLARTEQMGNLTGGRRFAANCTRTALLYVGRGEEALNAASPGVLTLAAPRDSSGRADSMLSPEAAICLAHLGRSAEARAALESFLAQEVKGAEEQQPVTVLTWLLETATMLRERSAASLLRTRLDGLGGLVSMAASTLGTCIGRHLGDASALVGEHKAARRYYDQALTVASKVRFRPEIALTHLSIAELMLEDAKDSQRAEALEHLDFAIGEFREMKMQPSLERALRHKEVLKA
jgi:hypothetical protein